MGLFDFIFGKKNTTDLGFQKNQNAGRGFGANVVAQKVELDSIILEKIKRRYIAFDVETTGFSATNDRIVEVGAVLFENGEIISRFSSLVNPLRSIPAAATNVNHITNEMLRTSPVENIVYPELKHFLEDALQGNTIICAHNAKFDMDFLCETFKRHGIVANICYVDTLAISRKYLKLDNYKQDTVAASYGITNENSHRAVTDAEVCGKILWKLLDTQKEETARFEKQAEKKKLAEDELEICAVIQNAILIRGGNNQWLRFYKNSNGYVDVCNLYTFIKFKFAKKGSFIIIPSDITTPSALPVEKCTVTEGGTSNVRLYFSSPMNIDFLGDYFYSAYRSSEESLQIYFKNVVGARREAELSIMNMTALPEIEMQRLLASIKAKNYEPVPCNVFIKRTIDRSEVTINPENTRWPISEIKNRGNFDRGFDAGFPLYERGEELRKAGNEAAAIELYDKARAVGYDALALYEAYAKAYRKLKDYDNEIAIIEEFMERNPDASYGELEARRDKAIELLYAIQHADKEKAAIKEAKEKEREEKRLLKEEQKRIAKEEKAAASAAGAYSTSGRIIIQMDDDGNVIKEYETVTLASKEVGVSTKCIRDAATGKQKHAGGFTWKYKEDI